MLNDFWALSAFRSFGMNGPLPITLQDILAYRQLFGDSGDAELFAHCILAADSVYLQQAYKRDG